jgi:uncharacterized protein YacL
MAKIISNQYFIAISIPVLLLFAGAISKKICRRSGGWKLDDFFLGIEFTLSALSAGFVYCFDLVMLSLNKNQPMQTLPATKIVVAVFFILITFILLLVVVSNHQDLEEKKKLPKQEKKIWLLGFINNLIGAGLFIAFILIVKGNN